MLLLRRRLPLTSVLVTYAACCIGIHLMPAGMGTSFLAYLVAAFVTGTMLGVPGRVAWCGGVAVAAQLGFLEPTVDGGGAPDFVTTTLVFTICWGFGLLLARRPQERAQQLRRLHERERAAAEAERTRLTHEVHDVLAHGLTVVVVQTVAAQEALRRGAPAESLLPRLDAVEDSARSSLTELRHLLRTLRDSDDTASGDASPPGVADLPTLVAGMSQAGVRVTIAVTGDEVSLDEGRDLAAYRIVQESLTNALKHAAPTTIEVRLDYSSDRLAIAVTDDGRPTGTETGSGHGLAGMRERVEAYGGEVTAGPRAAGGFAVEATLPLAVVTT
jgi:signal transduction histidine kinase